MFRLCAFLVLGLAAFVCGAPRIDENGSWRIVGGSAAGVGEAPYQVSLRSSSNSHFCGGTVYNSRTIVTAAHCLAGQSASAITVVVGTNTLNSGGTKYSVSRIQYHSSYDPSAIRNDVGVVITSSAISFTNLVVALPLSTASTGAGVSVRLTGWGTTSYPGNIPNNLQKIDLLTLSVSDCQSRLSSINGVYDTQVCTFTKAGQGACHGDSGGPLVANGQLVGIVSWGYPCAKGYPDVFTRVSSFASWIQSNSQN